MADRPRFPAPDERASPEEVPFRSPASPSEAQLAPGRTIVRRPEEEVDADRARGRLGSAKLTSEEVRALLAVDGATRPRPLSVAWKRGRPALVIAGMLGPVLRYFLGPTGAWMGLGLFVLVILWSALPLLYRDDWQ